MPFAQLRDNDAPSMGEIMEVAEQQGANSRLPFLWKGLKSLWPLVGGAGAFSYNVANLGQFGMTHVNTPTWGSNEIGKSLLFDDGSSEYTVVTEAVVASPPFTLAAWCRSNDAAINQTIISVGDTNAQNNYRLQLRDPPESTVSAYLDDFGDGGTSSTVDVTATWNVNIWHHACFVEAAVDDHRVFVDGGNKGTGVTSINPVNLDNTTIGASKWLSRAADLPMSGHVALACIAARGWADHEVAEAADDLWGMVAKRPTMSGWRAPAAPAGVVPERMKMGVGV